MTYPVIVTGVLYYALYIITEKASEDFWLLFGYKTQQLYFLYQLSGSSSVLIVAAISLIL